MIARTLDLPDVMLLEPIVHADHRGHFFEAWNERDFVALTQSAGKFVQDNQSRSRSGVLRGLHYQLPRPQGKLVRVLTGEAYAVAVDIRRSSKAFGNWVGMQLSADNHLQLWIPPGFAHGFLTESDPTEVLYKVTEFYAPGCDRVVRWDDPAIGIGWPLGDKEPILSDRDRGAPSLAEAEVFD